MQFRLNVIDHMVITPVNRNAAVDFALRVGTMFEHGQIVGASVTDSGIAISTVWDDYPVLAEDDYTLCIVGKPKSRNNVLMVFSKSETNYLFE